MRRWAVSESARRRCWAASWAAAEEASATRRTVNHATTFVQTTPSRWAAWGGELGQDPICHLDRLVALSAQRQGTGVLGGRVAGHGGVVPVQLPEDGLGLDDGVGGAGLEAQVGVGKPQGIVREVESTAIVSRLEAGHQGLALGDDLFPLLGQAQGLQLPQLGSTHAVPVKLGPGRSGRQDHDEQGGQRSGREPSHGGHLRKSLARGNGTPGRLPLQARGPLPEMQAGRKGPPPSNPLPGMGPVAPTRWDPAGPAGLPSRCSCGPSAGSPSSGMRAPASDRRWDSPARHPATSAGGGPACRACGTGCR